MLTPVRYTGIRIFWPVIFVPLLLLLLGACAADIALNDTYISLPNRIYLGLENKVIVRTTYPNTRITVSTTKYRLDKVFEDPQTYQTEQLPCGWYAVEIPYRVPFLILDETVTSSITLNFTMRFCNTDECDTFTTQSLAETYQVQRPPIHLLGETDKPLYRPGETVRFRFIVLNVQLLWPHAGPLIYPSEKLVEQPGKNELQLVPVTEEDTVLIFANTNPVFEEVVVHDPSDTRVKQWLNISAKQAFSLNYTLFSDAPTGKWKVTTRLFGLPPILEELQFTVKQYVLPRFTVSMTQPEDLSFESSYAQFSVCARYTNGPPMVGTVRAHLCVCSGANVMSLSNQQVMLEDQACIPTTWHPQRRPCVPASGLLSSLDGCVSFNVSTELLDLESITYPTWDQIPVICAHVEEQGTGSNVSRCEPGIDAIRQTRARFELQAPNVFKPGLPVVGTVRLIHPDLSSFNNITVRLLVEEKMPHCFFGIYPHIRMPREDKYRFTQLLKTDASGMAEFQIPPINAKRSVMLTVTYETGVNPSPAAAPTQTSKLYILPRRRPPKPQEGVTAYHELERWLAPQHQSMIVWPSPDSVKVTCPGMAQFQLLANVPIHDKVIHVQGVIREKHFHQVIPPTNDPDLCVDRDDHLGHYRCLGSGDSDQIECLPGWSGTDCLTPTCEKQLCHRSGGVCSGPDQCTCFEYWSGPSCDICTKSKECHRSEVQVEELSNTSVETDPLGIPDQEKWGTTTVPAIPATTEESRIVQSTPRRTLHLRSISFPVDGKWGPEATVVVFFMIKDVSSSGIIPVTIKLQNMSFCASPATSIESIQPKPGLSLSHHRVSPGQIVDLTLSPQGLHRPTDDQTDDTQYCFVRMQDKSLDNFKGDKNLIDLKALSQLATMANKYSHQPEPSSLEKSFRAAGLRLMSTTETDLIQPVPCPYAYFAEQRSVNSVMDSVPIELGLPAARGVPILKSTDTKSPPFIPKPRLRDFFPEVWLFDYYPIQWYDATNQPGEQNFLTGGHVRQTLTVPDTITSWRANAFCTTASNGLWIPKPAEMITSMPFFVEITLPNQVKRGEILYLPISVFASPTNESGLSDCMTVSVSAQLDSDNWSVIGGHVFTDCLCPGNKKTFYLGLLAKGLGMLNVTVEAYGRERTALCADEARIDTSDATSKSRTFSDLIRRAIKVEPEGIRRDLSQGDIICLTENKLSVKTEFPVVLPDHSTYVSDSLRVYLSYSDEVLGPALANMDKLVRLPVGCGEQNMVLVAPNVYVLDYVTSVDSNGNSRSLEKLKRDSRMYILTGYQRQQNYRHDDGSYSAFGKSDKVGSTWLTAFVLRVFAKAYKVDRSIQIDWGTMFTEITQFLKEHQNADTGCFNEKGRVLHTGMQGAVGVGDQKDKELLLNTYILSAILETRPNNETDYSPEFSPMVDGVKRCLFSTHGLERTETVHGLTTYALAQLAYAMILLSPDAKQTEFLRQELLRRKHQSDSNGLSQQLHYWRARETQDNTMKINIDALDVEATSYALLTLSKTSGVHNQDLFPIVRWLSSQQKPEGGFFSTQDTAMALEAIAQFAKRLGLGAGPKVNGLLQVESVVSPVGFILAESLTSEKQHVLNQVAVPGNLTPKDIQKVSWTLTSSEPRGGCLSVHSSLIYHEHETEKSHESIFHIANVVKQAREPPANACTTATLSVCLTPNGDNPRETGMLLVTVDMVSGWKPVSEINLKQISGDPETPRQIEFSSDDNTVSVYFDGFARTADDPNNWAENQKRCVQLNLIQFVYVEHAKPAVITAIDYYANNRRVSKSYKLDECPGAWNVKPNLPESKVTVSPASKESSSEEPVTLGCPICELSSEMNQTLMGKLSDYVCHRWSNLFIVKVLASTQDSQYNVTLSEIGFGRTVSSWNATLVGSTDPRCNCPSLIAPATLLWLSPNSKLRVDPGDPEIDIVSGDPDALLIPVDVAWPAIQLAQEQWNSRGKTETLVTEQPVSCSRIELLWRYIKSNLI
ncbi:hypothetical protein FGIG_03998 [Fasciola gigantica]|uniref:EGF-like domain-containing protein n=1 Tax=Fasciola gigantica TaxID=46835 RepID=A0A504YQK1_FASGI|nr:hypothetical protein FGIG_03998 [Fasciola gigantica]